MVKSEDLKVGMQVIIRDDVYNGQNGIRDAVRFRGRVCTIKEVRRRTQSSSVTLEEINYWWRDEQIDLYVEQGFDIDDGSFSSLLDCI